MSTEIDAIALYEYEATSDNHISLQVGDKIKILQQEENGWYYGQKGGVQGWFPASFVEVSADGAPLQTSHPDYLQYSTEDGTPYYVNIHTNESTWTLPSAHSPPPDVVVPQQEFLHHIQLNKLNKRQSIAQSFVSQANTLNTISSTKQLRNLTFIDPHPQPQKVDGRYGYSDNFVSDNAKNSQQSGFDILVLKHRNGKEVCKDMAAFMAERARIEEQYSKQLMELSKSQYGQMEGGTLKTAWNQLKFDMECQAKSRQEFAGTLHQDVHIKVMKFKDQQKKTRKDYEATIASERKLLLERYKKVQRMQVLHNKQCQEAEMADALVSRGQLPSMTRRDFLKVEEAARKERKKASMCAFDYRAAVKDFEEVRQKWDSDCSAAAQEFEAAELERISFLKGVLQTYLQAQKDVNIKCKDSSEMCSNSIESVSGPVDVELFVKSKFTGNAKIEPIEMQQYGSYQ